MLDTEQLELLELKAKIDILEAENKVLKKSLLEAQEHILGRDLIKPSQTRIGKILELINFHKWYRQFNP